MQFLPDVDIDCPDCEGGRYAPEAEEILYRGVALPGLLAATVAEAIELVGEIPAVRRTLETLIDLGLGYLTLGEDTPALSGGEAQRLKLAGQMGRTQRHAVFVFDEPSVGLHPLDVRTLVHVLDRLVGSGATVLVIEHDLDLIANADWVIDMGPGGGASGGSIVAEGTPEQIAAADGSLTGRHLARHLKG